jgi:transposase
MRAWARARRVRAYLPRRKDQRPRGRPPTFDRVAYRRRPAIERLIGRLKEWRAVATRYEKLAVNYLATVQLALLRDYLRLLNLSDRT